MQHWQTYGGELVLYVGGWVLDSRGRIEKRAVGV